jgi:hypothetical protein
MSPTPQTSIGGYYPARLTLRVPEGLPQAIEAAARSQLTSPSEYVRRAVLSALKGDGIQVGTDGSVARG